MSKTSREETQAYEPPAGPGTRPHPDTHPPRGSSSPARPVAPSPAQDASARPPAHTPTPRLVSACLAGLRCRYDARDKADPRIVEMVRRGEAVPVCPEELGGLPTPREAAAFVDDEHLRLKARSGKDVTLEYRRGAEAAARIAREVGAREAILKERSPSCGSHWVYQRQPDGSERLVPGRGLTARRLEQDGIRVVSEEDLEQLGSE